MKSVVSNLRSSVLCFQETKVASVSRSFLRSFAGRFFDRCQLIESSGASGGIITCWSSNLFSCSEVLVRTFSLTVRLKLHASGPPFYVTNVYGPPTWDGKEDFCRELAALKEVCGGLWIICWDFNLTRSQNERRGRSWSRRLMALFTDLINNLAMTDLPLGNQSFTWSNLHACPTLAKLDRFLISTDWDQAFPLTKAVALPRSLQTTHLSFFPLVRSPPFGGSGSKRFGCPERTSAARYLCGGTRCRPRLPAPSPSSPS